MHTGTGRGLPCPRCACTHHRTTNTEPLRDGRIRRRRTCRHCGQRFVTHEARSGQAVAGERAAQVASGELQAAR